MKLIINRTEVEKYWEHFNILFVVTFFLFIVPSISAQPLLHPEKFRNNIEFYNYKNPVFDECRFQNEPIIVRDESDLLFQYWTESDRSILNKPVLPKAPSLHEFRDQINRLMETDPFSLLRNQRFQVSGPDSINVNLVLEGESGSIRKMNCLEAILLAVQTERSIEQGHSMYSRPTEFLSYVLKKDKKLKIYYYTVDQPGIRGLGVFNKPLDDDLADGWELIANIHNHNFFPESKAILGGVVPSAADVQFLRYVMSQFGLNIATITNGFHSIDMSQEDLMNFSTWDTKE